MENAFQVLKAEALPLSQALHGVKALLLVYETA